MKFRVKVFLFVCLACLFLVNCRQNTTAQGTEISLNLGAEPPTIDPLLATDPPTIQVDQLLFANLIQLNESDGAPVPGLAREWLVSADGMIWEFRLRDDVYWVKYNVEEGTVEIQEGMIGNFRGVAGIYQQPDIFEIVPVGDTRKVSFQPRSPVTLIFVGASSQSFAYHRVALNVDQFQKSLSCQR